MIEFVKIAVTYIGENLGFCFVCAIVLGGVLMIVDAFVNAPMINDEHPENY